MQEINMTSRLISIIVAIIVVAVVFIPIVNELSSTTKDVDIENEGAGWLKLGYSMADYDFTIVTDSNVTVGAQSGEMGNNIYYADGTNAIFSDDDGFYLITSSGTHTFEDDISVTKSNGTLTISDGTDIILTTTSPSWAYIPDSNGVYGFFEDSGLMLEEDKPKVAIGSFAGAFAYNDTVVADGYGILPLTMIGDYADEDVIWGIASNGNIAIIDISSPSNTTIQPLNPSVLGGDNNAGLMAVPTPTYTDGDWGFEIISGTTNAKIVSYSGSSGNIVIPSTVTTGGVTYTVTELGKGGSDEDNVTIFDNSTINGSTITIPDSVTSIWEGAFAGCSGFTGTLTIPDSVTSISDGAFFNCSGFTGSLVIPDSVTSIGMYTFSGCSGFTSLVIGDSVTSISGGAFDSCTGLTSLVIGDSVTSISDGAFSYCTGFTGTLTIPDSVTTIGDSAFYDCSGFTSLVLGDSVTTIGGSVFHSCSGFTGSLVIPDSVTSIGEYAFFNCSGFTGSLVIPDSVTSIGESVFWGCSGLTGLINLSNATMQSNSFSSTTNLKQVLNLGTTTITATSYGLNADEVRDNVPAIGYVAPTVIKEHEIVPNDGMAYQILMILPVLMMIGVLLYAVYESGIIDMDRIIRKR